jgi:hypothetical protein
MKGVVMNVQNLLNRLLGPKIEFNSMITPMLDSQVFLDDGVTISPLKEITWDEEFKRMFLMSVETTDGDCREKYLKRFEKCKKRWSDENN